MTIFRFWRDFESVCLNRIQMQIRSFLIDRSVSAALEAAHSIRNPGCGPQYPQPWMWPTVSATLDMAHSIRNPGYGPQYPQPWMWPTVSATLEAAHSIRNLEGSPHKQLYQIHAAQTLNCRNLLIFSRISGERNRISGTTLIFCCIRFRRLKKYIKNRDY